MKEKKSKKITKRKNNKIKMFPKKQQKTNHRKIKKKEIKIKTITNLMLNNL
jgi:hypothetical protein